MQPAHDYVLRQREPFRAVLMHCMATIEAIIPAVELRYRYAIPFYYYQDKPFCYLNVKQKKGYVDVGFYRGFQLKTHQEMLVGANRTMVKSLQFTTLDTFDQRVLEAVLLEAKALYE
ncbi:DUF1801 domain-containing protein [Flavobacterium sp.]|jgi:hypothetical protein|uniref:DUF1801 domain-containing protein n=1 Tax=Flavobacterium sp. TaxID=239 RepID=UPI0022CC3AF9|nr:DUF1801 domain-containing protein [Flavobacterium sp.]MCZ8145481.1 DUF1801 domain-containing protein [Flavobacterium sp.]MCZ8366632.1 DUF1801 domain-containing protein [Flavobacterium sp.]